MTISAVVITLDEESRIEDCLRSVRFCDEVIVVDSGSRDATLERARPLADRVEIHPFHDFASQKNHAASLATSDWVLSLDADERVGDGLRREILRAVEADAVGFEIPRLSNFFGHWLRHGGFHPDLQLRLWRRGRGRYRGWVHERVEVDGAVGRLSEPLIHFPYETVEEWIATIDRHTSLGARRLLARGDRASLRRVFTTPAWHFLRRLAIDRAWRDGAAGVLAAGIAALDGFLLHAKHWAMATRSEHAPETRRVGIEEASADAR